MNSHVKIRYRNDKLPNLQAYSTLQFWEDFFLNNQTKNRPQTRNQLPVNYKSIGSERFRSTAETRRHVFYLQTPIYHSTIMSLQIIHS